MTIELSALLRRRKPEKQRSRRQVRPSHALLSVADAPRGRLPLVLDTNVYIANAAGRLTPEVEALLDRSLLFHCSVCLAELATGIANSNPAHPLWRVTRDHYADVLGAIPETRVLTPGLETWVDAGLLTGTLARTQGLQPYQRKELLNDALVVLTASSSGLAVLTSDGRDFDLIQQLAPEVRFYHY